MSGRGGIFEGNGSDNGREPLLPYFVGYNHKEWNRKGSQTVWSNDGEGAGIKQ